MNALQKACMFNTFIRIRTLVKLESATPAVDQPFVEVDGKEVDKMECFHSPTLVWYTAATPPLLLSFTSQTSLYNKRGTTTMKYSYVQE